MRQSSGAMLDQIRVIASRWGFWWVLVCVIATFAFGQRSDTLFGAALLAAVVGGFALGRIQDIADTRPCPRCGERVLIGKLECDACGFDFAHITR